MISKNFKISDFQEENLLYLYNFENKLPQTYFDSKYIYHRHLIFWSLFVSIVSISIINRMKTKESIGFIISFQQGIYNQFQDNQLWVQYILQKASSYIITSAFTGYIFGYLISSFVLHR